MGRGAQLCSKGSGTQGADIATRTLMDMATARGVGLTVETAHSLEFGTYFGPGSKDKPYTGRGVGPVVLHFGKEV